MNEDFRDFLAALLDSGARFLVAGAHALAVHGVPRATGDLDIWIESDPTNVDRVWRALEAFGAPTDALDISREDLRTPGMVVQIGLAPRRIDLMTSLTGVQFEEAWDDRTLVAVESMEIPVIGRRTLLENKRATGRLKDRSDLEALTRLEQERRSGGSD